ncbi:hypothetical protein HYH02_006947 [Chlamydomonas schloesseri]|uniref:NAD(P)-binding domain-containing protein n=1 Tax=Chlamydomonas schloesseri TaxID=2026947 RepID=A0A835WK83_9CHLO|nr:hypothetical protein HYH02_006947 [Chlamydomonas schloesseri]|eukprot:KAG2448365.1 hypothetical protein HYH02_006947 [Chlamydomonas schloesseri]
MQSLSTRARPLGAAAVRGPRRSARLVVRAAAQEGRALAEGDLVLVAGATGGVGQLVTAKLLERGFRVRAVDRARKNRSAAAQLFPGSNIEVFPADLRDRSTMVGITQGVAAVCCCTGTTAFPSPRWEGENGPRNTDWVGTSNLIDSTPSTIKRFVLVTSVGVERYTQFPFAILNSFGVLKYKRDSEKHLEASGLPYTIIRPGRLTDGPYTSYDLNTLLQATAGTRQDVQLSPRDDQRGEASRIAVAEAVVQSLLLPATSKHYYSICSTDGEGPGKDTAAWERLFAQCHSAASTVMV